MLRGRANVDDIVMHERENRYLVEQDGRTRLAETCGTREERRSSNMGRGKQEEAIRVDGMDPQVINRVASGDRGHGAGPARCSQHRCGKKSKQCSTRYAHQSSNEYVSESRSAR